MYSNIDRATPPEVETVLKELRDEGFMVPVGEPCDGALITHQYAYLNSRGKVMSKLSFIGVNGQMPFSVIIDRDDVGALINEFEIVLETIDKAEKRVAPFVNTEDKLE